MISSQPADTIVRFTLQCLRARLDPSTLAAAKSLVPGMDWEAWLEASRKEFLTPLLYRVLRDQDIVPPPVEARLKADYLYSARTGVIRVHALEGILSALDEAGVPVILLKGAALVETIYDNVACRPMADMDLLARREQMPAALSVLTAQGFQASGEETWAGADATFENELQLRKRDVVDLLVEIHWSLLNSPHYQHVLPAEWLWDSALPIRVAGVETFVLGPEALLLHLCAHLALHHHGQGLLWQHDIAEALHFHRDRLDWSLLLRKAAEYDLVLSLQQVLPPVVHQWNTPVPPGALERVAQLTPSPAERRVFKWLTARQRPVIQRFWADLATMPGWRPRLRYGLVSLFPSAAYMRQRYAIRHDALLPLYYPYRWWIGLWGATQLLQKKAGSPHRGRPGMPGGNDGEA